MAATRTFTDETTETEFKNGVERLTLMKRLKQAKHSAKNLLEDPTGSFHPSVYQEAKDLENLKAQLNDFNDSYFNDERILWHIARRDLWMLCVDGRDHSRGRLSYDEGTNTSGAAEKGYMDAAETAMAFVFKTWDQPLTQKYIQQLHFLACCEVNLTEGRIASIEFSGPSGFTNGRLPLWKDTVSKEGLKEMASYHWFRAWAYKSKKYDTLDLKPDNVDEFFALLPPGNAEERYHAEGGVKRDDENFTYKEELVLSFIEEYKKNIERATSSDERILAIAIFAKKMEASHLFRDGNLRTVRFLILKNLLQNQLPLTCIWDPNIIDGYASTQVAESIKKGFSAYNKLKFLIKHYHDDGISEPVTYDTRLFKKAKALSPREISVISKSAIVKPRLV